MTYLLEFYMPGPRELLKDRDWKMRYLSCIAGLFLIFSLILSVESID
jgi:hypothetical protein